MALLTYPVSAVPASGVPAEVAMPVTAATYRPYYGVRDLNAPVYVGPSTSVGYVSMPSNGGTYGPARGGTVVTTSLTFIWGSIVSS